MKYALLCLLACLMSGCSREQVIQDIPFPETQNGVAVYCLLTPGDSVFASLKISQPISTQTQDSTTSVTTAQIIIQNSQTNQQAVLRYLGHDGLYGCSQQEIPVQPGNRFSLTVRIPGSTKPLQASCTVPAQAADIDTFTYGTPYADGAYQRRRYSLSWRDVSALPVAYNYAIILRYAFPVTDSGGSRVVTGESLLINEGFEKAADYV
ncbi:DUF4249 family protein [Arsenicibacter rosenii]|uniref:DUF4249 domain-containing protein n=1 Tax=Arsenicibacter rosenii TaxID=1750698 RepID=A0A1S2VBN2_9BACT|nr:DUF4249 family protein [Arsenicibacter rosenii]OIN55830.1 hypothetical protein BLX24_28100 [Arsenicibacter rosenii]